ncbi:hypothetical protein FISHEDRAFT_32127, partial [Fistulina hepatica ATCC 64428]
QEFEALVRQAQAPLSGSHTEQEAQLAIHPDAPKPMKRDFEGDVNPVTGERGGPKTEPVKAWGDEGDWSYKGRVTDF